jgi:hypothetical protein
LFIIARVEYLRHDVELMFFVLSRLSQLRSDIYFLVLVESQACCVPGLEIFRKKILYDERVVGLQTGDAARVLPLDLQLRRTALEVFRYKYVVLHLEVRRPHVHLVVVLLNSSFAITRIFLCHLCVDLGHSLRHLLNLHKLLRFDKVERRADRHAL